MPTLFWYDCVMLAILEWSSLGCLQSNGNFFAGRNFANPQISHFKNFLGCIKNKYDGYFATAQRSL